MSQYECCSFVIDKWIDTAANGRTNLSPKNIPWDILRVMITEMYGGKIDDEDDFDTLGEIVDGFMTPAAFEENYVLVKDVQDGTGKGATGLTMPSGIGWKDFTEWVNRLPEREPPTYLGLPANAEKLLLVGQARDMMENLGLVLEMLDEGEQVMAEAADA